MSPLFRANTLVDILANKSPDEIIALRSRRYLAFNKGYAPRGRFSPIQQFSWYILLSYWFTGIDFVRLVSFLSLVNDVS